MTKNSDWWNKPRQITVIIDNESWILPFGKDLVSRINQTEDTAILCRTYAEIPQSDITFYLGCIKISPPKVLAQSRLNLVIHESDLPEGRGMSPLTWQIIEGKNDIPVCLLAVADEVDAGEIFYRDTISFEGHELVDELRTKQGQATINLSLQFLAEKRLADGIQQIGELSYYQARGPKNSKIDPNLSIADQFDLLRTVDNKKYPAFFDHRGHRYKVHITKMSTKEE
jgi:methionyl-tRNA formyltransferase